MAQKDGDLNFDVGMDGDRLKVELESISKSLKTVTGDFTHAQAIIQRDLKTTIDQMVKIQSTLAKTGKSFGPTAIRQARQLQLGLGFQARGGLAGQQRGAAADAVIADIRNSAAQAEARILSAIVKAHADVFKSSTEAIQARLRLEAAKATEAIKRAAPEYLSASSSLRDRARQRQIDLANNPGLLAAQDTLRARRNQDTIREARIGQGSMSMERTFDRLNSNGGADISGLMGRIMIQSSALMGVFNALRTAKQFVIDLDAEFKQFQAITASTNDEMKTMKDRLIEVSAATKFTALEITKAATVMGQAGFSAREVSESIKAISLLATATGSDLATAVDVVTSSMSIFDMQTSQAADIANTLTAALNLSKLSIDKVTLGLQYAGNTAAQMGVSFNELLASLGALANSGIRSGSTLGTGMRQLLIDLQNPSEEFTKKLKTMGLTMADIDVKANGFFGVMEKLKQGGFSAADAFQVFEVRAASAFAALSNNTDLAYELQRNFILSSAAAEANAVQMESLANTMAKAGSAIGVLIYRAFEPLVAVMQKVIKGVTEVILFLNRIPAAAQVVGVALTALGTAAALSTFSALIRGLRLMIPLFGTAAAATTASTVALEANAVAAGAATAQWGILNRVMMINPFIRVASLILAGATAFYALSKAMGGTEQDLDSLKGTLNEMGAEADATAEKINGITETIDHLISQKAALDANPLMRQARIMEVVQQFKELGASVDASKTSVATLIEELQKLSALELQRNAANYAAEAAAAKNVLAKQEQQKAEYFATGGAAADIAFKVRQRNNIPFGDKGAIDANLSKFVADNVPALQKFVRALMGDQAAVPSNVQEIGAFEKILEAKISDLVTASSKTMDSKMKDQIAGDIDLLQTMLGGTKAIYQQQLAITQSQSTIKMAEGNQARAATAGSSDYQALDAQVTKLEQEFTERMRAIQRSTAGSAEDSKALKAMSIELEKKIQELKANAGRAAESFSNMNQSLDKNAVSETFSQLGDRLAGLQLKIKDSFQTSDEAYRKVLETEYQRKVKLQKEQLQRLVRARDRATTKAQVEAIQTQITDIYAHMMAASKERFQQSLAAPGLDDGQVDAFKRQYEDDQENLTAALTDNAEQNQAALDRVLLDGLKQREDAVDAQMDAVRTQIELTIDAIKHIQPGAAMDKLIATFQSLKTELDNLANQKYSLGIRASTVGTAEPLSADVAGRAAQLMRIFMGSGLTYTQAAGLVGGLIAESNLDPNALGDNGTSFGIAQHHADRWTGLRNYAAMSGGAENDLATQAGFILKELNTTQKAVGDQLRSAQTLEEAATAALNFERPKAWIDGGAGAQAELNRRLGLAQSIASVPVDDVVTVKTQKLDRQVDEAREEAYQKSAEAAAEKAVRAAELTAERISTGVIAGTAGSIDEVLQKFLAAQQDEINAKLKAFDADNYKVAKRSADEFAQKRSEYLDKINQEMGQNVLQILDSYYDVAEQNANQRLADVSNRVQVAQAPENSGAYTQEEIAGLQEEERLAKIENLKTRINLLDQERVQLNTLISQYTQRYGQSSAEVLPLVQKKAELEREILTLKSQQAAQTEAAARDESSLGAILSDQAREWKIRNGLMNDDGTMVSNAQQVGDAWGTVLNGMTTGVSEFFMTWSSDLRNTGSAFKNFGLMMINTLQQVIAQALTLRLIMAAMNAFGGGTPGVPGAPGGGGFLSTLMNALFTTGAQPAARGTIVQSNTKFRDSKLYKLMDGEAVLNRSAVKALGEDNINSLNNLGNRQFSESVNRAPAESDESKAGGGVVNVYVVTPEQVPSRTSDKDIVVSVADNIGRKGVIHKLIKSVAMGVG